MIKKKQRPAKTPLLHSHFCFKADFTYLHEVSQSRYKQALQATFTYLEITGLLKKSQVKPNDVHSFRKLLG